MVKKPKTKGTARVFISRKKVLRRLQLSLKDFRRLCILKGVYPREPLHIKKANNGSTENKIFYHLKDINYLAREPILDKFREYKIFLRKLSYAKAKKDKHKFHSLLESKPVFSFDHIVKERYPTFASALRDLDDALCLCFAFSRLTRSKIARPSLIDDCLRLTIEFLHYVVETNTLRKVFVSIKGVYYQAEIMGEKVTWVVGHERAVGRANEMDFSVMANFVEFYTTMLTFVNFRLYKSIGLFYPPKLRNTKPVKSDENEYDFNSLNSDEYNISLLAYPLLSRKQEHELDVEMDVFDDGGFSEKIKELKMLKTLFKGFYFFLNREVPRESLSFVIRSCGGLVTWDGLSDLPNESSELITHQVVDRNISLKNIQRTYVQPQWIFDSVNARRLLPTIKYSPNAILPPHLSPFVDDDQEDYIPKERIEQLKERGIDITHLLEKTKQDTSNNSKSKAVSNKNENSETPNMFVQPSKVFKENKQKAADIEGQSLKLREMMLPKKHKRVYEKIKFGIKRKRRDALLLEEKRRKIKP